MTKLNNKGVSLIDCLIAVAVLALLVSPIIAQLFTTIQVSAEAKEKQYVIDDATEVYEYFRKYDNKELENTSRANEEGFAISSIIRSGDPVAAGGNNGPVQVELRLKDGTLVTPMKNGAAQTVEYDWTKYVLDDSDAIGRENNIYKRTVVRTNLRNKLYELGYQIDYSVTNGSTLTSLPSTYQFRSDNSIVQYASTGDGVYDDSVITGIVVKKKEGIEDSYINELLDPNEIDIGNVQDIDADKMAIISGDATAIDYQLDLSLQNVLVQYATSHPASAIGTYADDPEGLNRYIKSIINNSSSTSKVRKIKVYVTAGELDSTNKPKYYVVKCDVTYRVTFSGTDLKAFDNYTSTSGEFTYPVLERKYYTTTPPDIYMIYEPLLISTSMDSYVFYADNDYISIYTDEFTSGVDDNGTDSDTSDDLTRDGKDPSRLYLIRSIKNWANVANNKKHTRIATDANVSHFDDSTYYTYRYGKFVPVNIFINMEKKSLDGYDDLKPIDIYTNISKASLHTPDANDLGQFVSDDAGAKTGLRDSNNNLYPIPPSTASGWNRYSYDPNKIIRVDKEKGIESVDRLGQITVTYQQLDKNTNLPVGEVTYITGAKGAD